jgi:hypothetical protein
MCDQPIDSKDLVQMCPECLAEACEMQELLEYESIDNYSADIDWKENV